MKCETARLLKLTTTGVEPLSFIVPRKGDFFQEARPMLACMLVYALRYMYVCLFVFW